MFKRMIQGAAIAAMACFAHVAAADTWTLDSAASKLAFGSIKKDKIGEVHSFETINGTVAADGSVAINIDLTSVQTNIDIRNERMKEHVFKGMASAKLMANIDPAEIAAVPVGGSTVVDVEGTLSLLGASIEVETEMFVARLSESKVMVSTNDMIFLSVEDAGLMAGVDKLMELAKLPGITRTSPVTLRLIFNMDEKKAEAAPAAPATTEMAFAGDVKKGKKVFKKCKACHSVKAGKNGAGPTLHAIMGAPAAAVEGFKYSTAMKDSGLVWDADTMAAFLAKPKKVVPGTKMAFPGLKKEKDVQNLLAYLAAK